MPKYRVPVTWMVGAIVEIEAEDEDAAQDLATGMDLDTFEGVDYIPRSFDVDMDMIEEVDEGEEETTRTEKREKIRMSSE